MQSPPFHVLPPARPRPRRWGKRIVTIGFVAFVALVAYAAGRTNPPSRAGDAVPDRPHEWAVGVWFKKGGDGFELPAVELRKDGRTLAGRLIIAGAAGGDRGLEVQEVAAEETGLSFVTTAGGLRAKYRLTRSGPESADLFAIDDDPAHALGRYLGQPAAGTSLHSAERREQVLKQLNAPRPPERLARLTRVAGSASR